MLRYLLLARYKHIYYNIILLLSTLLKYKYKQLMLFQKTKNEGF